MNPETLPPLRLMDWRLSVADLPKTSDLRTLTQGAFFSLTQTPDEYSVVCETSLLSHGLKRQDGWRCLRIEAVLDFSLVGILARLSGALAASGISLFALSTYQTDYVLIRDDDTQAALDCLRKTGYTIAE